ncbi:ATP-binding protein [Clostridium sp. CX1]|uniref:ATP-binding protein n=1 Tax=Clostridium sp. CX1 TaxID=2978346 RepID=UPI0021C0922F|nr:ATP-binding protein [Clostridium sp. CX1]MCT8977393.1 ATP-binding protein [Clostridium sp. CX1]
MQIVAVMIKSEYDIISVRQRAKKITSLAGLSITDQTRFVTAVSEIARNTIMYGKGGKVEFSLVTKRREQFIQAIVTDNSLEDLTKILQRPYKLKNGMGIGISGAKNLVDYFNIEHKEDCGNIVTLGKEIVFTLKAITSEVIRDWTTALAQDTPKSFVEELQAQNQVLMQTLESLEQQEKETKKQLEETIRLNKELKNANQELKDFAYVVSHDLKAPLRGISFLAGWIAEDYKDKLDDEGNKMIDMLLGRIRRMNNLIDGILQYSRVGRVKEEKVPIDFNELVKDVINLLSVPENIEVRIENKLPNIFFEETRASQVFQNLIGNAVKYMDKPIGQISIGSIDMEGFWQFYIRDNGPGIEQRYFKKIFKIFKALNSRDKVEGTGIGLTIVKKIVELYGGRIWLESIPMEGTTFFFTLKK